MSDDTARAIVAVILAAGQGTRMGAGQNKVLMRLRGMPILAHTLAAFEATPLITETLLVAHPDEVAQCQGLVAEFGLAKVGAVIAGGTTRHQSEDQAFAWLRRRIDAGAIDLMLIHDGARPLVTPDEIAAVIAASRATGGALLAAAVAADETLLLTDSEGQALQTWPSDELALAQTPQAFDARTLLGAYDAARAEGFEGSDTAASFERAGGRVRVVLGPPSNLKVTTPDDLHRAEAWLESQSQRSRSERASSPSATRTRPR
jgi:2-C-methyl-D-erythritol 4-phosphate cytidylyltransferase